MIEPEPTAAATRSRWLTLGLWAALAAGLVAAFGHNFAEMWIRWFPAWSQRDWSFYDRIMEGESYYTHGPLIPLVSLLIAVLLIRHTRIPVRPRRLLGGLVLGGSVLLHLMACLARVNFVSGFAMIGVLAGLILVIWGGVALRRLWFPLALLGFMVPLPEVSIANLNFSLKMLATTWGVKIANLLGVIAERSGNRVFLEEGKSLVVANVCNGLRTLISLTAFGALYAYVCRLRGAWRIGLFAMTIPVAVVSNAVRIVSLIAVADLATVELATGWYHDVSGVLIFVLAFLLMFSLERAVLWSRRAVGRPAKVLPLFHGQLRGSDDEGQWGRMVRAAARPRGYVALGVMGLAVFGAWWLNRTVPASLSPDRVRNAVPEKLIMAGHEFVGYDQSLDRRTLTILEHPSYLYRRYEPRSAAGAQPVDLCLIFSKDNRKGTHPPDLCLSGSGEGIMEKGEVTVGGIEGREAVSCRYLLVQSGNTRQYYLYTYKCGDRYTGSFWTQQLVIFLNGLVRRDASGALIRISTPVQGSVGEAKARSAEMLRAAVPHLDRNLGAVAEGLP
jgi:EpsI family protein